MSATAKTAAAAASRAKLRSRRARRVARLRRREERQADGRFRARQREGRQLDAGRRARHRQGVHGAHREDDGESLPARRSADEAVVGLHEPVAVVDAADAGRARRARRRAGEGRQALQARGLGGALPVRLRQAVLPHRRALAARGRRQRRGPRRRHAEEGRLLHAPVHRRAGAVEFRADQPGSVPRDDRDRRPEPREGACTTCSTTSSAATASSRSR